MKIKSNIFRQIMRYACQCQFPAAYEHLQKNPKIKVLDPGKPGVRQLDPVVHHSLQDICVDLTDVTLADEDTNSILADNTKRAIQGNASDED